LDSGTSVNKLLTERFSRVGLTEPNDSHKQLTIPESIPAAAEKKIVNPGTSINEISLLFQLNQSSFEDRDIFFVNDLPQVKLPVGTPISVTIVDKSNLDQGMLSVYERFKGYSQFYKQLNKLVHSVAQEQAQIEYFPAEGQLILAPFKSFYCRAVCLQSNADKNTVTLYYLDFGNIATIKIKQIRKFPGFLMFSFVSNLCHLQNLDDKDLDSLRKVIAAKHYVKITVVEDNPDCSIVVWNK
jgi:hypothetical protein